MKKLLISAVIAASLGAVAVANAATPVTSGTITFTGKVIAPTCTVSVNNGPASQTVNLTPYYDTTALTQGNAVGWTPVTLTLSNCGATANASKVYPYFTGANIDAANGYLANTVTSGNGGSNVEVVLSSDQSLGNALTLQNASGSQGAGTANLPTSGTSTLSFTYYAAYVAAKADATAGTVNTSVQYALNYQ
ncbi:fimbrial protein [Dyella sedimenti]|jgi:major type 1 subunit fimbrin (pilin)|uniref:fimbrial protein n=1 Tax=Dyella sedimenti TaxID=2919947 RepID=UPI001FAA8690|nr:fimbrial protein [Dyella sedimenti]